MTPSRGGDSRLARAVAAGAAVAGPPIPAGRTRHVTHLRAHRGRSDGADGHRAAVLVIGDELPALDEIIDLLDRIAAVGPAHAAGSSSDALRPLQKRMVVLLDIRMPSPADEDYAVRAFEVRAGDYLLKPVSHAHLEASLQRALHSARHEPEPAVGEDSLPTIPVETTGRIRLIDRAEVCWVEAKGDYVRLHLADGSAYLLRMPISHLEEKWSAYGFIRIHRGHLVPIQHITEFAVVGRNHSVTVAGRQLPVSRRHARDVRDRLLRAARKG